MKDLKSHYNDLYSSSDDVFGGGKPDFFVTKIPDLSSALVLEIGAGQGKNAIWLAKKGYEVEVSDISEVAINKILEIAKNQNLKINGKEKDSREKLNKDYDIIINTFMLHHLKKDEAISVLSEIKKHTKTGGYNVISVFTKEGDFYNKNPKTEFYFPDLGELKEFYSDWSIQDYVEEKSLARQKKEDGSSMFNIKASIIARKP